MTNEAAGSPTPETAAAERTGTAAKRPGVPAWRTGKPDSFLAAAVDVAREAVESIANASDVGSHLAARTEGDRVVTHLFECRLPGYPGWQWFVVLTRNSRSKVVTVNEVGLLPSDDAVLAPEWVPWAERVRPEDAQADDAQADDVQPDDVQPDDVQPDDAAQENPDEPQAGEPGNAAAVVERDVLESVLHTELAGDSAETVDADAVHTEAVDGKAPDGAAAADGTE